MEQSNYRGGESRVKLIAEDIGHGVSRAIRASRSLVERKHADMVVGLVSPGATRWLSEIFETSRTPFIEASAGERIAQADGSSPWIFHNSLHLWQASMAMGQWAAREMGRRCVIASSEHDSGFDAITAFRRGFEQAGGTVIDLHITGSRAGAATPAGIVGLIASANPDFVAGFYSREDAAEFTGAYRNAGLANRIPLIGSGLMADTHELDTMGGDSLGMRTALSWSEGIGTAQNRAFMAAYRRTTGKPADAFALLGYDTAAMIVTALSSAHADRCSVQEALGNLAFTSPRGELRMDKSTRSIIAPLYLSQVRRTVAGPCNAIATMLGTTSDTMIDPHTLASRSGWLNSYLSV